MVDGLRETYLSWGTCIFCKYTRDLVDQSVCEKRLIYIIVGVFWFFCRATRKIVKCRSSRCNESKSGRLVGQLV